MVLKTRMPNPKYQNRSEVEISQDLAVALSYDDESDVAPRISAIARRHLADEVKKLARRYGIPLRHDAALANELSNLPEQEAVPPEFYQRIAAIFSRLNRKG